MSEQKPPAWWSAHLESSAPSDSTDELRKAGRELGTVLKALEEQVKAFYAGVEESFPAQKPPSRFAKVEAVVWFLGAVSALSLGLGVVMVLVLVFHV